MQQDGWIIEGVYHEWVGPSVDAADVIIVLAPSMWLRHWRVIRRFVRRKLGRLPSKRESLADLWRLLRWSHAYDATQLAPARRALAARGRELIECRSLEDVLAATAALD